MLRDVAVVTAAMIGATAFIGVVAAMILARPGGGSGFEATLLIGTFAIALGGYFYVIFRPDIRKWRRRRAGMCVGCGYDREGLTANAPCPECGLVP